MNRAILLLILITLAVPAIPQARRTVTANDVERWMTELSNWGRWGKADELGALNLITPAKRRAAAALVKEGIAVSLSRDAATEQAVDNGSPFSHKMTATGINNPDQYAMDTLSVSYHGWAHTHMDALSHMFHKGRMYNGFAQQEITAKGAGKLGVNNVKNGIFTRGILIDIPRLKNTSYLEPGTPIHPEDLEAWENRVGLRVTSGDVVFIRTGRWARRAAKGAWDISTNAAGLHASCAAWLKKRDVAMLGSDAASDVMPSGVQGVSQPIHQLVLIAMGTPIFDNCDLERVSETAAKLKRWEFLLTTAPLAVQGGTGSPLNPVAVF